MMSRIFTLGCVKRKRLRLFLLYFFYISFYYLLIIIIIIIIIMFFSVFKNNRSVFVGLIENELTIRIVEINEKIEQLKNDVPQEPELSFEDAKINFTDAFSVEQQRAILHNLIKKIVLQGDEIQVYWRFE